MDILLRHKTIREQATRMNMLTALYDGNCVVCRSTCEAMRALDWRNRIEFVDLHESEGLAGRRLRI